MKLELVQPQFVDFAWKDGASCLAEACALVDEITGDQLKMMLSRGERTLVRLEVEGVTVGWGCYRVDQLPNLRVLHITDVVIKGGIGFENFFDEMKKVSRILGCSRIRLSCPPAQARLYRIKLKEHIKPVYETFEVTWHD